MEAGDGQGFAVGGGALDGVDGDAAGGAGAVLDNVGFAGELGELLRQQSGGGVDRPAGREADNDGMGLLG